MFSSDIGAIPTDARAALEKVNSVAEGIIDSWVKKLESRKPAETLYHYTSDAGLKGILDSGNLWLTDVFDFNDPSELSHGVSIAASILRKRAEQGPPEAKLFSTSFDRFATGDGLGASAHYFACCFSACGNDLGQWRAYADNGRGFVLEFETESLVSSFAREERSTFPITYSDDDLSRIHTQIVESAYPLISLPHTIRMTKPERSTYVQSLSSLFSMHILSAALFFKHEAYANETEFRFLELQRGDQPATGLKFRSRPYALARYGEFCWRNPVSGALKRIIIGPAADKAASLHFVRNCLRAFHPNPESVEIDCSRIPYRAQ